MTTTVQDHPYRIRVAIAVFIFDLIEYEVTPEQFEQATIGARVAVPFMNKKMIGIIVEKIDCHVAFTQPFKLKPIIKLFKEPALFDLQCLHVLSWAAHYYQSPIGEVVLTALPNILRQGRPYHLLSYYWKIIELHNEAGDEIKLPKAGSKLYAAYQSIKLHKKGASESILNMSGVSTSQLKQLEKRGLVEHFMQPIDFSPTPMQLAQMPLDANAEQDIAIKKIRKALGKYESFLLDGITGSGKTEVYLQAIQTALERDKQVLVLVPEIGLTPQTVERFKARFLTDTILLHSSLTDSQRLQAWQQAQTGKASIILGTRLAIFCPLPRLGLIILDEEHDLSYKQQDMFRYHARDVALYRAFKQQCPVVLGSATPSFESLYLVQQQKMTHLRLKHRAGTAKPPSFKLIDLKSAEKQHGLAKSLIETIRQQLEKGQQVLVFINRRGYAPVLMCTSCGWQADCPRCDAHLTLHYHPRAQLQCHHCDLIQPIPTSCPSCQATELKPIGSGTARIEEHLQELFPDYPIFRVDRDTTMQSNSWEKVYQRAYRSGAAIFLGTQMLAKGHHFPYVSLVTILDIDAGLMSVDFRAPERTAQLIMQVAGRAGRGQVAGQVLLQSYRPDHPLLQTLIHEGYAAFAEKSLAERKIAQLPPYRYAALIRAESQNDLFNLEFLQMAAQIWPNFGNTEVEFWGPIPAPMQRKAGAYRAHLLMFCSSRVALQQQITLWWQWLFKQPRKFELRIIIDIDPQELS
ncbi:primosomal protein N' [Acinetobacter puyangensis]|uniref:primosomal protein N' n=1 Tax=Acinetobacter puyangensis TaxID=1096779 RepID=UPI003A4E3285